MTDVKIPYLLHYDDPILEQAYHRYLAGEPHRSLAPALKIPARTLARHSGRDGWEIERRARRSKVGQVIAETVATDGDAFGNSLDLSGNAGGNTPDPVAKSPNETPRQRMERMLVRQQVITDRLAAAVDEASAKVLTDAEGKAPRAQLSIVAQVTLITSRVLDMQRKAYRVPDKMEVEDTTPAAADRVRTLTDDQLDRELAAAEGRASAAIARKAPPERVN